MNELWNSISHANLYYEEEHFSNCNVRMSHLRALLKFQILIHWVSKKLIIFQSHRLMVAKG